MRSSSPLLSSSQAGPTTPGVFAGQAAARHHLAHCLVSDTSPSCFVGTVEVTTTAQSEPVFIFVAQSGERYRVTMRGDEHVIIRHLREARSKIEGGSGSGLRLCVGFACIEVVHIQENGGLSDRSYCLMISEPVAQAAIKAIEARRTSNSARPPTQTAPFS